MSVRLGLAIYNAPGKCFHSLQSADVAAEALAVIEGER